ncbi:hypothetical protein [Ruixingdingia sedimenti]|uniref:Uncharacterized protein n=1 Tax=Ruixingdingia sedimenti TaxID=3073604 RepID=A0ABU1FEL5_9RHOB|nr:hypothetical protein [Xinfangfangia sp. LG-4]MDR5655304.1 hypothetical protein [Xinfangfangia sp. LG-4]
MSAPDNITLTVPEVRQVAARAAMRLGAPFDRRLMAVIDDIIEDVILVQALGPEHTREKTEEAGPEPKKGKQNE